MLYKSTDKTDIEFIEGTVFQQNSIYIGSSTPVEDFFPVAYKRFHHHAVVC